MPTGRRLGLVGVAIRGHGPQPDCPRLAGMSRIVYATATSLDGYLADADGSLDWLFAVEGGDRAIAEAREFMRGVTVQVEGSSTYGWVVEHEQLIEHPDRWQAFYGDRATFVFTSRPNPPIVEGADVRFVSGPVTDHVDEILTAADGGDVHLVGGGALAAAFADVGRLDAIHLSIAPVTLGGGAPLFPTYVDSSRLHLTELHQTGQFVHAEYAVLSA
jgi:dihydrofolate reductase